MIPILILAAGQSSRMRGTDKLCEKINGRPLLRHQARIALDTGQPVYVALPAADHPRAQTVADLRVTRLTVPQAAEGLSGTLRGAVAQLPQVPAFLVLLADLVAITCDDLNTVLTACQTHPDHLIWRGMTEDGKPGHPIIFHAHLRGAIAALQGDSGGDILAKQFADRTHLVPLPGQNARLDLDTPEDWAAWRAGR